MALYHGLGLFPTPLAVLENHNFTSIRRNARNIDKGIDFRISRETIRMTKLFDGNVSVQNFFQADIGYTHNRADNNNTFSGLVNWNYGLHYQFRLTENFKLLAGGLIDVNGGFVYNLRNTNNPATLPPLSCWRMDSGGTGHSARPLCSCPLEGGGCRRVDARRLCLAAV